MENLQLDNFKNSIAYLEAMGLSKCFSAYAEECSSEDIMSIGFNSNSGYVYIALENGIQICSMLGNDVEYITYNFEDGQEAFYDTYLGAVKNL
jgi:hypothetical protein